jgi:hypothetical protein
MMCALYRSCGPGDEQHPVPGVCGRDRAAGHLPPAPHSGQAFTTVHHAFSPAEIVAYFFTL